VLFPSFDFNIIVDLRCGLSVFYGRWFSSIFLVVPMLVPPKGSVARSFFAPDFVRRATPSCAQVSAFPSRNFDLSSSAASVCRRVLSRRADRDHLPRPRASAICPIITWLSQVSVDRAGALSDRHLAQPGLCPIVSGLCPIVTWLS
jgi:hypothetical protein